MGCNMRKKLLVFALFFLWAVPIFGQSVGTAWVRRYNGPGNGNDYASGLAVDGSSNVYVTGKSWGSGITYKSAIVASGLCQYYDYATIKYYPNGDTAWVRRYNGSGNNDDVATSIALDGSGNVYVTGQSYGSGTGGDYATIKYYPNGDTAWVRRYNGPENGDDKASDISLDDSGKVYVTGTTGYGSGFDDFATIAYYPNGDTAWVRRYNGLDNGCDRPSAITVDDSNNVYLIGMSEGIGTSHDFVTIRYRLFKSRSDTLWFVAYSPVDLIVTAPNGDSIGVGFNCIPNATYNDTIDLDHDGEKDDMVAIPNPLIGEYMVRVVAEPGGGTGNYTEAVKLNGNEERILALDAQVPGPGQVDTVFYPVTEYLRGDPNRDGKKNVSDVIYLINYVVKQGPSPEPVSLGDVDCNGDVTIADIVYLVNYLFKGGKAPCS